MLWRMWIRTLDLHKTLGADPLVAASSLITISGVIDEANGAFVCVLVQIYLDPLSVDVRISR